MKYLLYLAILMFIISIGSTLRHTQKNPDANIFSSVAGKVLMKLFPLLSFVLLILCFSHITGLSWYWNIPIAFIAHIISWEILTDLYSSNLGVKSQPQLSLFEGGMVKHNLHIVDAVITFTIGLIIFYNI